MSGLFARVLTWFANEVIVSTLANSKSFQRFALRTDAFLMKHKTNIKSMGEEYAKTGEKILNENASVINETKAKINNKTSESIGFDISKFISVFREELKNEMKTKK